MICKKCKGQGVITKITQMSGDGDDVMCGTMGALITMGASLLVTTRLKEATCPRCHGSGKTGWR